MDSMPNSSPEVQLNTQKGSDEPESPQSSDLHWPSAWQLGLSLLAVLLLWGIAGVSLIVAMTSGFNPPQDASGGTSPSPLLIAAGAALAGALMLPSAGYAFLRLSGRPRGALLRPRQRFWLSLILLFIYPAIIVLGDWVVSRADFPRLILPLLHVLGVGIPVYLLLRLGQRGLREESPQRTWGIFGSGLVLGPTLSLAAEFFAVVGFGLLGLLYLSSRPELADAIINLAGWLTYAPTPEAAIRILSTFLLRPEVLYVILIFGAVVVPLIEEIFKPIGVWLLARRSLSPSQGFVAGLLSGAGYALFENLALSIAVGQDWAAVVIARMGTSLMHMLTSALMGWALTLAWKEGRYLRLGLSYLLAVVIHAMWNGLVLVSVFHQAAPEEAAFPMWVSQIGSAAPLGLITLIGGGFLLFMSMNMVLRRAIISSDS